MKKSYIYNGASLIKEQYEENEWQTNKAIGYISLGFFIICLVTQILLQLDYSYGIATVNMYIFFPMNALNGICYYIAWRKKYKGAWIKYMLMSGIIIISVGFFFAFTTYMAYFVLVPIFISTRYFNKDFIHQVSVATIMLFLLACALNLILEPVSEMMQLLQSNSCYNSWKRTLDAVVYIISPMFITFVFVMLFSLNTSKKGRMLLKSQGESAGRIAAVEAELNMAADIQRSALPEKKFDSPNGNFRIAAEELPAKEVGGDFYDYFMVDENTLAFLIADVSDKGVPAAMFMMSAKKAVRCAVKCCGTLKESIELANKLICDDNKSFMFLTLWLGMIDTRSGRGKYINAGHIPPVLRHSDGSVSLINNEPDLFIGNFPDRTPAVNNFSMSNGDVLLLYTDGLTDAMNRESCSFGIENVVAEHRNAGSSASSAVENVFVSAQTHSAGQEQYDDITLLALECIKTEAPDIAVFDTPACNEGTSKIIDGVNDLLTKHGCNDEVRRSVDVAVDELCVNIADYAYEGRAGQMRVEAEAGSNYITLTFIDSGVEFNPLEQEEPELFGGPVIGGLGIFFVKSLVDTIDYQRIGDKNAVTITKLWNI